MAPGAPGVAVTTCERTASPPARGAAGGTERGVGEGRRGGANLRDRGVERAGAARGRRGPKGARGGAAGARRTTFVERIVAKGRRSPSGGRRSGGSDDRTWRLASGAGVASVGASARQIRRRSGSPPKRSSRLGSAGAASVDSRLLLGEAPIVVPGPSGGQLDPRLRRSGRGYELDGLIAFPAVVAAGSRARSALRSL